MSHLWSVSKYYFRQAPLKQSFLALNSCMPAWSAMLASHLTQTGRMRGSVGTTLVSIWQQEGVKGLFK